MIARWPVLPLPLLLSILFLEGCTTNAVYNPKGMPFELQRTKLPRDLGVKVVDRSGGIQGGFPNVRFKRPVFESFRDAVTSELKWLEIPLSESEARIHLEISLTRFSAEPDYGLIRATIKTTINYTVRVVRGQEVLCRQDVSVAPSVYRDFYFFWEPLEESVTAGLTAAMQKLGPTLNESCIYGQQERQTEIGSTAEQHPAVTKSDIDRPAFHLAARTDDYAVVVGVEKYANDLPDAQFAERDAAAVKANLLALGYQERNIKFLTGQRATGTSLASYIEDWLPRNVNKNSSVFFYFSGHGAPNPKTGQAYIIPWDGNPSFLDKTAYPLKRLYSSLSVLKVKQVLVALDSCFSGSGGRSVLPEGARPLVSSLDIPIPGTNILLFAATSPSEITSTMKDQGHGSFTYYFLKGLGGAAKDKTGRVTPQGLYDYLRPKVQDAASRQNREQTPVMEGTTTGEMARF